MSMPTMQLFTRLTDPNDQVIDIMCDVLKNAYNPALSNFFIYRDSNFKTYLCSIVDSPDVYIFYTCDHTSNELTGFVIFEIDGPSVYLRNIIINHQLSANNIGSRIFFKSLDIIKSERSEVDILQLDALGKNGGVLNWYLSIGMKINRYLYWYDITDLFKSSAPTKLSIGNYDNSQLVKDAYGFTQLTFNGQEIGSLIQQKYLVVKTTLTQDILSCIRHYFFTMSLLSVCLISNEKLNLLLIERAAHLVISLQKLKTEE
ncbi:MAG: hypothetical protein AAGC65_02075 [Mucilaginibacter sp.]|uniref:hypothetical protein n=1 Tax=Mucilaginibacter sp. TaxID=1882438 RepID=UPI0031A5522D